MDVQEVIINCFGTTFSDCGYNFTAETCAYYDGDYFNPEQKLVYPLLTGLFMCLSAFGMLCIWPICNDSYFSCTNEEVPVIFFLFELLLLFANCSLFLYWCRPWCK